VTMTTSTMHLYSIVIVVIIFVRIVGGSVVNFKHCIGIKIV
jgi:hypothetical protein